MTITIPHADNLPPISACGEPRGLAQERRDHRMSKGKTRLDRYYMRRTPVYTEQVLPSGYVTTTMSFVMPPATIAQEPANA